MDEGSKPHHKLMRALWNRPRIEAAYFAALRRALDLRLELRELELSIRETRELLELSGGAPWPPLTAPTRPPTLHEAMRIVLETRSNRWLRTTDLAMEIRMRGRYRRRNGLPPTAGDVSARVRTYPALFKREGYFVKLRLSPPKIPPQARDTMSSNSSFQ
jgi:hypothetical protein